MEKKDFTAKYFRENLPEWKRKKDSILVRFLFRPISFYTSSIATKMGISANAVSFFSAFIALVGSVLFIFGNKWTSILGAVTIWFWMLLDCTDGNIARSVKKQPYGEFADASSSYILINFLFAAIGISIYKTGGFLVEIGTWWVIFLGTFTGSSDSLARLLYQKFENSGKTRIEENSDKETKDNTSNKNRLVVIHDRIDKELGLNGLFLPLLLLCSIFNCLDLYLFLYSAFYIVSLLTTYMLLIYKTKRAQN